MQNQNEMRPSDPITFCECGTTEDQVSHTAVGDFCKLCGRPWMAAPAAAPDQPSVSPAPAPLDLEAISAALHDARHGDSEMSDWGRRYGLLLIAEIERLMELSAHPPVMFYQPDAATAEKLRELLRSQWEGSGAGQIILGPVSEK